MPMMMMMMIPSSSTVVDVHTDARRSTSSTSSRCSSSRRASFVRSPSVVAHDCRHAFIHGFITSHHQSRPRSVAARSRAYDGWAERLRAQTPYFGPNCTTNLPFSLRTSHSHPHPILYRCVSRRADTSVGRRVVVRATRRPERTRRPRERDARTTTRSDSRTRTTGDHVGRVTVRVTVHAQGARDDETRRRRNGWMDGMREGRAMDGWMMTRWGRDDEDERWLEGERGTGGWETIGSGVCRRAWGGKTASERTRRRG